MPSRPCLGCGELVAIPASWCPGCAPPPHFTQALRGGGQAASRFRAGVLARAEYRCEVIEHGVRCDVTGARNLQAHHVEKLSDGGDAHDLDNGRAVCHRHHRMLDDTRRRSGG